MKPWLSRNWALNLTDFVMSQPSRRKEEGGVWDLTLISNPVIYSIRSIQVDGDGWTTVAYDLSVWLTACYSSISDVQCHNTCLQIIAPVASLFHSPASALLLCSSLEPEWIACHSNNPPSLLLPISPLLCRRTSLNKRPSYPSCLLPFSPAPFMAHFIPSMDLTPLFL